MHPIETIRVSKQARDKLITLKRLTGVEHWNTLCRWAFCVSLAEQDPPHPHQIPADSPLEMNWRTFAGEYEGLYLALLKQRCMRDGLDVENKTLANQFRLHLNRGIGYLAGNRRLKSIVDLVELATAAPEP